MSSPYWPDTSPEAYAQALAALPRILNTDTSVRLGSAAQAMDVFGWHTWLRYPFLDGAEDVAISVIDGKTCYTASARLDPDIHWSVRAYHPPAERT